MVYELASRLCLCSYQIANQRTHASGRKLATLVKGGLAARTQTKKTQAIQKRIDTLYIRYDSNDINSGELLEGLSYVIAKNSKFKKK